MRTVVRNWPKEEWVFTDYQGRMLPGRTLQNRWEAAVKRAGLPYVRMHDLRHAAATRMLEAGIPLKVVSEYLGHANISITADVYQHVTDEMARKAGEALGGILRVNGDGDAEGHPQKSGHDPRPESEN